MIGELIREIKYCLDNGCCMAALSLVLILPDICGKAIYSDLKPSERYIKRFDEYIGQYEHVEKHDTLGIPYLSGKLVYSLRNSVLHQGNPNIDCEKFGIIYFELLYQQYEHAHLFSSSYKITIINDENGNERIVNKKFTVNIRDLCWKICSLSEVCYREDRDKFDFFNYNLVDMDYYARDTQGIKEGKTIK